MLPLVCDILWDISKKQIIYLFKVLSTLRHKTGFQVTKNRFSGHQNSLFLVLSTLRHKTGFQVTKTPSSVINWYFLKKYDIRICLQILPFIHYSEKRNWLSLLLLTLIAVFNLPDWQPSSTLRHFAVPSIRHVHCMQSLPDFFSHWSPGPSCCPLW